MLVALICAIFPGLITAQDPLMVNTSARTVPPSLAHLFGTDNFGRDVFARVVHGTRIDLKIGILGTLIPLAFGSILGLVTMEDILEQMVGEIHDEFDVVERPLTLADGALIFDAALNVRDLDTQYNITLPEDPAYATVGGFVLDQLGFIPKGGESFEFGNSRFSVVEMDGKRVARVKIQRVRPAENEIMPPAVPEAVLQPSRDSKGSRENS